jgi:hypothetical protein
VSGEELTMSRGELQTARISLVDSSSSPGAEPIGLPPQGRPPFLLGPLTSYGSFWASATTLRETDGRFSAGQFSVLPLFTTTKSDKI